MITIKSIKTIVYRYPLKSPVQTSFGIMSNRPMVLVRIEDKQGDIGWGEIWCNFPNVGAEHRARLADNVLTPILLSKSYDDATDVFNDLTKKTWVLGIQTGEYGTIAQCIAGFDTAIHDLVAKKIGQPIWKMLGGVNNKVLVYASGINPNQAAEMGRKSLEMGINRLKLKIGFGNSIDMKNLTTLREMIGENGRLMADVNQAWSIDEACVNISELKKFKLEWLEEPIPADRPLAEWKQLEGIAPMPLAAGENLIGMNSFQVAIENKILSVIQPDLAKWGGFTCCVPIARAIIAAGLNYCPHYLGGGIGLIASGHALAAVGGDGMLEVDINENPLRTELLGEFLSKDPGKAVLGDLPGLGVHINLNAIDRYKVLH